VWAITRPIAARRSGYRASAVERGRRIFQGEVGKDVTDKILQQQIAENRQQNTGREPERPAEWPPESHQQKIARERREASADRARRILNQ
jgi:hypothetical protein